MKYTSLTLRLSPLASILLAMLTIWSLSACNGKHKHRDYDDEEEEEEETETSFLDNVTDEDLASFNPDIPLSNGRGHSQPFQLHPLEEVYISAPAGAFDENPNLHVQEVTYEQLQALDERMQAEIPDYQLVWAFDLDAGLPSDSVLPGKFMVEIDMEKLGVPEDLYPYVRLIRVDDAGRFHPLSTRVRDGYISFAACQNSVFLTCFLTGVLIAAGTYVSVTKLFKTPVNMSLAAWKDAGYIPSFFKKNDLVKTYVSDDFGNFTVIYRYSQTENAGRTNNFIKKSQQLEERLKVLMEKAKEQADDTYYNTYSLDERFANALEASKYIKIEACKAYYELLKKDEEARALLADPDTKTPQSVQDIIKGMLLVNRFCQDADGLGLKPLTYDIPVYLVDSHEIGDNDTDGLFQPLTFYLHGRMLVNYDKYLTGYGDRCRYKSSSMQATTVTLAHEMGHAYENEYLWNVFRSNLQFFEAIGSVTEHWFTHWLKLKNMITIADTESEEANKLFGYTHRDCKQLLAWPLGIDYPEEAALESDAPQTFGGYMLGDLVQYLCDHSKKVTFDHIMTVFSKSNSFSQNLIKIFDFANDREFATLYEKFCWQYMKEIALMQDFCIKENHNPKLVIPLMNLTPDLCVKRITDLGHNGTATAQPFAVKTVEIDIKADRPYTLFAVPSEKVKVQTLKFAFLEGDSMQQTRERLCLKPCKKNNIPSICHAAIFFRPGIEQETMDREVYFDIIALYQPTATPEVKGSSLDRKGLLVQPKCTPPAKLKDKGYVTGLQIVMENNKTGNMVSYVDKVKDWKDEFVATFDRLGISDTTDIDVSLRSRWYYDTPQGQRYYSPATDVVNYKRQATRVEQTVEQDTTQIETGTDIMGEDDEAPEKVNIALKVKSMGLGTIMDPMAMDYYNTTYLIRFVAENGRFTLTVPPLHVYKEDSFNHNTWNITQDWPGYTLTGNCNYHDVMYHGTNYRSVALDDNSFQISSSALHQSMIRNNCDEFGSNIIKSTSTEKWEFSLRKRQNVPRDDFKDSSIPLFLMFRNDSVEGNIYIPIHTKRKYKRICEEKTEEYEEEDDTWLYLEVKPFI